MDYRCITNKSSKQYDLIFKKKEIKVSNDGLLRNKNGSIAVALSSRYGDVGDELIITLSTGKRLQVIKADEKAEKDLVNNCYHACDNSMIEVLVDVNEFGKHYHAAKVMGDFNYSDLMNGSIVKIEKILKQKK